MGARPGHPKRRSSRSLCDDYREDVPRSSRRFGLRVDFACVRFLAEGSLVHSADRWLLIAQIFELDDEQSDSQWRGKKSMGPTVS